MTTKFLYRPVKFWNVGQRFGEDKLCTNGTSYKSKKTEATCPVGYYSLYKNLGLAGHTGLDIGCYRGQPVLCSAEGTVVEISTEKERGLGVGVLTKVGTRFFKHTYWHFEGNSVKLGQKVEVGDLLGWADSTGLSSGDHLHFQLKETDSKGYPKNYENGYKGAIDPEPYLFDEFAGNVGPLLKRIKELMAQIADVLAAKLRNR